MNSSPSLPTRGFTYVATGQAYLQEAFHSAATLRALHPAAQICLITDCVVSVAGPFSTILKPAGPVAHKPIDKLLAYEAPYEHVIFLDTDTHVVDDLSPIFDILARFDLALLQDVNRGWNYPMPDVPLAFSEFNTGVIAFRKDARMKTFFADWRSEYTRLRRDLNLVNDQPAFRRTLFHSSLRVAPLPNEFHFLGDFPNSTLWRVRLIHGRGNYARIARQVNESLGLRTYLPELGIFPGYLGRRRLVSHLLRFIARCGRLLLRGPENVTEHHPSKWWLEEGQPPAPPTGSSPK